MQIESARVGAIVVDSLPFSEAGDVKQARALKAAGVSCLVGYLGVIDRDRLAAALDAGLAFLPVTRAGAYSNGAADELAQLAALGIPHGTTVWLDVEGPQAFHSDPSELAVAINRWADAIGASGYQPALYVGVPQPLTSAELSALHVVRYWRGQGSIRDRHNALAEPSRGWTMTQVWPSIVMGGTLVDANIVGEDYHRDVPSWVTGEPAAPDTLRVVHPDVPLDDEPPPTAA